MSIENSGVCRLCQSLEVCIHTHTTKNIQLLVTNIILEHLCNDNCYLSINTISAVTTFYIFSCAVSKRTPSISVLTNKLKTIGRPI